MFTGIFFEILASAGVLLWRAEEGEQGAFALVWTPGGMFFIQERPRAGIFPVFAMTCRRSTPGHPLFPRKTPLKCKICKATAVVALRSHNAAFCPDCYLKFFARQVEKGIEGQKLFTRDERILVALSGGKDSTAMLLRLLEEKRPVDLILFCDTGLEFPQMYEHLARLEAYIGRPITRLKAEHDFEYYFLHYTPKRKNPVLAQYSGMSWAGPRNRWCTGILKTRVVDVYLKELRKSYTVIEYVGIAADEPKRLKDKTYPLAEWGMTEKDCLNYCYERGFDWGGLYEIFHRVSCWCCPLQSLDELRKLHRRFPDLWQQLETWDDATWRTFIKGYSARDLAVRFDFEERWQKAGGNLRSRAFYAAMREEIQRRRTEVKPCLTSRREMLSRER